MKKIHQRKWALVVLVFMSFVLLYAANWEKLGMRTVKHSVDRDVILVGAKEGTFTALKFTVKKAGLHFLDMKVHFVNGDVKDVQIRKMIPRGGETRVIDLPGNKRQIEKVVFWYKTPKKNEKAARVRLWGRH